MFLGIPSGLAAPSLFTAYRVGLRLRSAAVVGISQSGRSPDVVECLRAARRAGALTLAVTNEERSPLASAAHETLPCRAGKERAVPATKTFTAELACLYLLLGAWAGARSPSGAVAAAPELLRALLAREEELRAALEPLAGMDRCVVLGRGLSFPIALETALKLKEAAGVFAEGASAADFLHGPVAMVKPGLSALILSDGGAGSPSLRRAARGIARAGGRTLAFSADAATARSAESSFLFPKGTSALAAPFGLALLGQLAACRLAERRGSDPDRPAGLGKVTSTR
jgi:glucosamine--fructose-6-phosphate aminotransferase (isomerizing)